MSSWRRFASLAADLVSDAFEQDEAPPVGLDPEAAMLWHMHRNVQPQIRAMVKSAEDDRKSEARARAQKLMDALEPGCGYPAEKERHRPSRVLYAELCMAYLAYRGDPEDVRVAQARRWIQNVDGPLARQARERTADLALLCGEYRQARSLFLQLATDHPGEDHYVTQARLADRRLQQQRQAQKEAAFRVGREALQWTKELGRDAVEKASQMAREARDRVKPGEDEGSGPGIDASD